MPTDEERREVAARMRYVAEHGVGSWYTSACCIAECLGEVDYRSWSGSEKLFTLLADLIEPEERTCRIEPLKSGSRYLVSRYTCCGYELVDSLTDPHASNIPEGYCPNCGAKVVEE